MKLLKFFFKKVRPSESLGSRHWGMGWVPGVSEKGHQEMGALSGLRKGAEAVDSSQTSRGPLHPSL